MMRDDDSRDWHTVFGSYKMKDLLPWGDLDDEDLLTQLERFKALLIRRARSQHTDEDEAEYRERRSRLLASEDVGDDLPRFVRLYRGLDEFWPFIKTKFSTYAEREAFLHDDFRPIIDRIEGLVAAPCDPWISSVLLKPDRSHVRRVWQKCVTRRHTDPDGAITSARTLLETVCKYIIRGSGGTYKEKDDLHHLFFAASKAIDFHPDHKTDQALKEVCGCCRTIVQRMDAYRNSDGDAHGRCIDDNEADPIMAEFMINCG